MISRCAPSIIAAVNVLHVAPFYEPAWAYGGMARACGALCRALARRGHQVTVVTARLDPAHAPEEGLGGVRVLRFECPAALNRRLFPWTPALRGFLLAEAPRSDIAHVHGHRSGFAWTARRVFQRVRLPYVLETHGTYPAHRQRGVLKWSFDRLAGHGIVADAAALLALSDAEARELPQASTP
jgi:glycosyltransferase involved in cell wall biosynthesis